MHKIVNILAIILLCTLTAIKAQKNIQLQTTLDKLKVLKVIQKMQTSICNSARYLMVILGKRDSTWYYYTNWTKSLLQFVKFIVLKSAT